MDNERNLERNVGDVGRPACKLDDRRDTGTFLGFGVTGSQALFEAVI